MIDRFLVPSNLLSLVSDAICNDAEDWRKLTSVWSAQLKNFAILMRTVGEAERKKLLQQQDFSLCDYIKERGIEENISYCGAIFCLSDHMLNLIISTFDDNVPHSKN